MDSVVRMEVDLVPDPSPLAPGWSRQSRVSMRYGVWVCGKVEGEIGWRKKEEVKCWVGSKGISI